MADELHTSRKEPPTPEEWEEIWPLIDLVRRVRWVLTPLAALRESLYAIVFAGFIVVWLANDAVIDAIRTLLTGWGK